MYLTFTQPNDICDFHSAPSIPSSALEQSSYLSRGAAATTAAVASADTAALLVVSGRGVVVGVVSGSVNADGDEAEKTVLDGVTQVDVATGIH